MLVLGLLETDPNWPPRPPVHFRGITRRFVLGMALLSCAVVLLGLPLVQIGFVLLAPTPFEYRNLPFEVCSPGSTTVECREITDADSFKPGDVVPFVVDRCATDLFARSAVLPYVLSRNVVNDQSGTRIILPSLSTEVPAGGCDRSITLAHQLPESIAPGRYYLEGVATVYGRFRTVNAYFKTETFTVVR
jgi:hypothetical protein